jgi:hypothetical protein
MELGLGLGVFFFLGEVKSLKSKKLHTGIYILFHSFSWKEERVSCLDS